MTHDHRLDAARYAMGIDHASGPSSSALIIMRRERGHHHEVDVARIVAVFRDVGASAGALAGALQCFGVSVAQAARAVDGHRNATRAPRRARLATAPSFLPPYRPR